jgi:hypothetical protein
MLLSWPERRKPELQFEEPTKRTMHHPRGVRATGDGAAGTWPVNEEHAARRRMDAPPDSRGDHRFMAP